MSFPSDSKIWGPGVWFTLHVYALDADTYEKIINFIYYVKLLLPKLPCDKCREHALQYLENNPIENYFYVKDNEGIRRGMFKWTWTFHNAVNTRLGKMVIDYDTAIDIYEDPAICTDSCSQEIDSLFN